MPEDDQPDQPDQPDLPVEMTISAPRSVLDAQIELHDIRDEAHRELEGVIVGYEEPVDLLLIAAVAGGHVLLEGPPGVAKTLMAGAVARLLGVNFRRVQFTPDTTPGEITGRNVTRRGELTFTPGAVFTNILLADEINRTPPRTQAALLEAMQDHHVTVEGRTHWLPSPFMVIATQNPYEQDGIFPLPGGAARPLPVQDQPELHLGRPRARDSAPAAPHTLSDVLGEIQPMLDTTRLETAQVALDSMTAPDQVVAYIVDVVRRTREAEGVILGASPRASLHLLSAAEQEAERRFRTCDAATRPRRSWTRRRWRGARRHACRQALHAAHGARGVTGGDHEARGWLLITGHARRPCP